MKLLCLLFCIRINVHHVTKAFRQVGTVLMRCCCHSGNVERYYILCDVVSHENEKPTRSKYQIQKLNINTCYSYSSSTLTQQCHQISQWRFPIKRQPCSMEGKLSDFNMNSIRLSTDTFRFMVNMALPSLVSLMVNTNTNQIRKNRKNESAPIFKK